ncbi:GNAT family N-acetyltransferase [Microbacterium sp. ASV81]|uniref:GNAT family N-acetyltransferase n=1 Tax=Microbacterium capsulatum TaxID=3041921 RepID=A0ABU0XMD1_9MICO|nr:GNAT family N-acetyltransferase [Microbacterium sp. ASV81]MDQ4215779.1 GNAT family N-acetyltransferase [Microbacterium sp. ASV81]
MSAAGAPTAVPTGVTIRMLDDQADLAALIRVFDRIWGTGPGRTMLDLPTLVALRGGGHFVSGAFVGDELVGGCIGFHVEPLGRTLHSHIAGVLPAYASAGVGRALKQHQREWCRDRGIDTIRWTFDPLIARNAHFNLSSLGAVPYAFAANYYGVMSDGINAGDESDRLTVAWAVADAERRPPFLADDAAPLLDATADGRPVVDTSALLADRVSARIPSDIERMRLDAPALARSWRLALRDALSVVVGSADWIPVGFDAADRYVFSRRSA